MCETDLALSYWLQHVNMLTSNRFAFAWQMVIGEKSYSNKANW